MKSDFVEVGTPSNSEFSESFTRSVLPRPGLAKMNDMVRVGSGIALSKGHSQNRFKRDYLAGTATYICKSCSAELVIYLTAGYGGDVLSRVCNKK